MAEQLVDVLEACVRQYLGLRVWFVGREAGSIFAFWNGAERLDVTGARASIGGTAVGNTTNYLAPGPQWEAILDVMSESLVDSGKTVSRCPNLSLLNRPLTYFEELPTGRPLSDVLIESDRLAHRRTVAFGKMVQLISDSINLEIWPLERVRGHLMLPFRLRERDLTIEGGLRLDASTEPVPLWIRGNQASQPIWDAWAAAVLGAAALLCRPIDTAARTQEHPTSLDISDIEWRSMLASMVVGHIRTLGEGRNASPEARQRACDVGIALHRGQTWVRPHDRGGPCDHFRSYRWVWRSGTSRLAARQTEH